MDSPAVEAACSPTLFYLDNLLDLDDLDDWGPASASADCAPASADFGNSKTPNTAPNATPNADISAENAWIWDANARLVQENANLLDANAGLVRETQALRSHIATLQNNFQRIAATSTNGVDATVRFSIGGHDFVGKLSPEIHFARAGSQFAVYPPGAPPPAVAELGRGSGNSRSSGGFTGERGELVPFVGHIYSIAEVAKVAKVAKAEGGKLSMSPKGLTGVEAR